MFKALTLVLFLGGRPPIFEKGQTIQKTVLGVFGEKQRERENVREREKERETSSEHKKGSKGNYMIFIGFSCDM